jgi:hypothetical protein
MNTMLRIFRDKQKIASLPNKPLLRKHRNLDDMRPGQQLLKLGVSQSKRSRPTSNQQHRLFHYINSTYVQQMEKKVRSTIADAVGALEREEAALTVLAVPRRAFDNSLKLTPADHIEYVTTGTVPNARKFEAKETRKKKAVNHDEETEDSTNIKKRKRSTAANRGRAAAADEESSDDEPRASAPGIQEGDEEGDLGQQARARKRSKPNGSPPSPGPGHVHAFDDDFGAGGVDFAPMDFGGEPNGASQSVSAPDLSPPRFSPSSISSLHITTPTNRRYSSRLAAVSPSRPLATPRPSPVVSLVTYPESPLVRPPPLATTSTTTTTTTTTTTAPTGVARSQANSRNARAKHPRQSNSPAKSAYRFSPIKND